eukprot:3305575-Prymnesium_polylepis.1
MCRAQLGSFFKFPTNYLDSMLQGYNFDAADEVVMPQGGAFAALRTPGNPSQCPPWRFPGHWIILGVIISRFQSLKDSF